MPFATDLVRTAFSAPVLAGVATALLLVPADALALERATASLADPQGNPVGTVELTELPGGTLLHARLENMPPGEHAFHIHAIGDCVAPDYTSAGGHYNPDGVQHGFENAGPYHAGDMPNVHIPENGRLEIQVLNTQTFLDGRLFDDDGASIVLHVGPDDYESQPAGAAGARIACGVIRPVTGQ